MPHFIPRAPITRRSWLAVAAALCLPPRGKGEPGTRAPGVAPLSGRAYRADATILLLAIPIFSRSGVGGACFLEDRSKAGDRSTATLRFAAGSRPDRASGLNRLGFIQETLTERPGGLERAVYFGFMTSSTEENIKEARASLESKGGDALPCTAIRGVIAGGHSGGFINRLRIPASLRWEDSGSLIPMLEASAATETPLPALSFESPSGSLPTFLYAVLQAMRSPAGKSRSVFVYNGKLYNLETRKEQDPGMGRRLAGDGIAIRPECTMSMSGVFQERSGGRSKSSFRLWFDSDSASPLPVRFEFKARSFLRLAFQYDPAGAIPHFEYSPDKEAA